MLISYRKVTAENFCSAGNCERDTRVGYLDILCRRWHKPTALAFYIRSRWFALGISGLSNLLWKIVTCNYLFQFSVLTLHIGAA